MNTTFELPAGLRNAAGGVREFSASRGGGSRDARRAPATGAFVAPGLRWHERTVEGFEQLHRITVPVTGPFPLQTITRQLAAALHDCWVGTTLLSPEARVTSVSAQVEVHGAQRSLVLLVTTDVVAAGHPIAGAQMVRDLRRSLRSLIAASSATSHSLLAAA